MKFKGLLLVLLALGVRAGADEDPRFSQYQALSISAGAFSMPYRLYRPAAQGKEKLPLLLMLHSITERGSDNLKPYQFFRPHLSADFYSKHPCVIAIPQCPQWKYWWNPKPLGALDALIPSLLAQYPEIDPSRLYVTGVSLGGYGVYALLAKNPGLFAAAVPICGDPSPSPLKADMIRDLPIWIFHGAKDRRVSVKGDRAFFEQLKAVDPNAKYTEYPDEGHRIAKRSYAEDGLWDWVFEQKKLQAGK